ncbi:MAG: four helix bundle protein [Candidatus Cloacimonetes bacterium]|nr:four helix bundle protein [Candidatus Cloacimonadota bacterium]
MTNFKDLTVYKKAFSMAMEIYHLTKSFPKDELYSLTNQIRKSSRSVCSNIAEGYRKRQYPAHFISKISDADMENSETQVWIDFAFSCNYIDKNIKQGLENKTIEIGRLLNHMIENPEKYKKKSNPSTGGKRQLNNVSNLPVRGDSKQKGKVGNC